MGENRFRVVLIAVFAAGALFRVLSLGSASLWHDEAHTWLITRLPVSRLPEALLVNGVHPPLYFASVKLVTDVLGDGETALRMLSAAADLLTMLALSQIGRRLGGRVGQLSILIFWAFHPMAVWYAREARPYALAAALTTILLWLYVRSDAQIKLGGALFVAGTIALGTLTHYFFFIPCMALIGVALWDLKQRPDHFRRWTLISMAGLVPLAGWQILFFSQAMPSLGIGWILQPSFDDLAGTFWNLLSGYGGRTSPATLAFGLAATALIGAGLLFSNNVLPVRRLFAIAVPGSLAAVWILSQRRPVYMDRYFMVLLPIFAVTAAAGASAIYQKAAERLQFPRTEPFAGIFAVAAILLGLWSAFQVHTNPTYAREDWRGLIVYLEAANQVQEPVYLQDPETIMPLEYYATKELQVASGLDPELCGDRCWWILRQPYTYTHAFTSSVTDPDVPWHPADPEVCLLQDRWGDSPGIALWQLDCD